MAAANDREGDEVEIKEEEMFEVEIASLVFSQAPGQYQQSRQSKALNYISNVQ